jgi:hypothetical protein
MSASYVLSALPITRQRRISSDGQILKGEKPADLPTVA